MKSSILALFALGVAANELPNLVERDAPTLVDRDIATVTSVVSQVDTGIKNLDMAVQSFSGDATQMNMAAQNLLNTLNTATAQIQQTSNLSIDDALSLQNSVGNLQTDGNSLISDLENKKPAIEAASLCSTVFQQSSNISTAAQALIQAVVSKLPQSVQSVGNQLASGVISTLQQPQMDFSPSNCTNGVVGVTSTATATALSLTRTTSTFTAASATGFGNFTATNTFATATATGQPFQVTSAAMPLTVRLPVAVAAFLLAAMML